ncbi:MAG: phosphoserine phosphatase SerB [Rhodospirillaceae bacterium]|nr:phosphoserine phosphatase SerB [Rhodospirillaceae bacterium]
MDKVLTLIGEKGRLDETQISEVVATLAGMGAMIDPPNWLSYRTAVDLPFMGIECEDARDLAYEALGDVAVDAIAQPSEGRRKKLLVADMESTIIENEMLDELADEAGIRDRIADITARAMNGELDFEGAIKERVGLLAGLEEGALARTAKLIRITEGAENLIATMRENGAICALVSGGFTYYTAEIRERLGFNLDQANQLEIADGKLTGRVIEPILGRDAKEARLRALCDEHKIPIEASISVGDGANDLAMLAVAGIGVAFHAKPLVAREASARVDHGDLTALLYIQGYRDDDFVS